MKSKFLKTTTSVFSAILFLMVYSVSACGEVKCSFLYNLSNFTGTIPFSWARIVLDKERNEIYIADFSEGSVRIFNEHGMEVYGFGDDGVLGYIHDIAVDEGGNILVLSYTSALKDMKYSIIKCNYRGEEISKMEIKNLPAELSQFTPNNIERLFHLRDMRRKTTDHLAT